MTCTEFDDGTPVRELASLLSRVKAAPRLVWHTNVTAAPHHVLHQIIGEAGRTYGSGELAEEAIDTARRMLLSEMPAHRQTRAEFAGNTLVIPVTNGAGKTGTAHTGVQRMLVANLAVHGAENALYDLRQELTELYYRNPQIHTREVSPGQFVDKSIANLLKDPLTVALRWMPVQGGRNIVFAMEHLMRLDVEGTLHRGEVESAVLAGKIVPAVVMADYPDLMELAVEVAMRQDRERDEAERELLYDCPA